MAVWWIISAGHTLGAGAAVVGFRGVRGVGGGYANFDCVGGIESIGGVCSACTQSKLSGERVLEQCV